MLTLNEQIEQSIKPFNGQVFLPGESGYEATRRVYNAYIDIHPKAVLECRSIKHIVEAIIFAKHEKQTISVRGGGHNYAGLALNNEGFTIDISKMRAVEIDSNTAEVTVEGAARLGDIDKVTAQYSVAVPLGTVSDTGIGGLALGGGIGWLSHAYGLTCDNILEIDLIDAKGQMLQVNRHNYPDLFWALKGGGAGNFGIVTRFKFLAYPLEKVFAGSIVFSFNDAENAFSALEKVNLGRAGRTSAVVNLLKTQKHGKCISLDLCCLDARSKSRLDREVLANVVFLENTVRLRRFVEFQKYFDEEALKRLRRYSTSIYFDCLNRKVIERLQRLFADRPSESSSFLVEEFHGEIQNMKYADSAFCNRSARFNIQIHAAWENASQDEINLRWIDLCKSSLRECSPMSGSYINYNSNPGDVKFKSYPRDVLERLLRIKNKYDPDGVFKGTLS